MQASPPVGERSGAFFVFKGWSIPGKDIAYYAKLAKKIPELTAIALKGRHQIISAFTSDGYMKACAAHDWSRWKQTDGIDLYIRVDYPGWKFLQGMDSPGNDIDSTPTDYKNNIGGMITEATTYFPAEKSAQVAAFTTNGFYKYKVNSKLLKLVPNGFVLDGLYVRTEFFGYDFYPQIDSNTPNITTRKNLVDDVTAIIEAVGTIKGTEVAGFNTDGEIKSSVDVPPNSKNTSFTTDTQGIYIRTEWPGFIFLPSMDLDGSNVGQIPNAPVAQLIASARADNRVVAFTTDGTMKGSFGKGPIEFNKRSSYPYTGLYVKLAAFIPSRKFQTISNDGNKLTMTSKSGALVGSGSPSEGISHSSLNELTVTFGEREFNGFVIALQATAFIWARYFITDSTNRLNYSNAVRRATDQIHQNALDEIQQGHRSAQEIWMEAAEAAHDIRNTLLIETRSKTTALGLSFAVGLKPDPNPLEHYLNKNSRDMFGVDYAQIDRVLHPDWPQQVMEATVRSAGRANPKITNIMRRLRTTGQAVAVISLSISMYSVLTANEWQVELFNQLSSWSLSIVAGTVGSGVGAILGPAGAILGGIAGGLAASIGAPSLSTYFFGGSSTLAAASILENAHEPASAAVAALASSSDANFHVHYVYASDLRAFKDNKDLLPAKAKAMVSATPIVPEITGTRSNSQPAGVTAESGGKNENSIHNAEGGEARGKTTLDENEVSEQPNHGEEVVATLVWVKTANGFLPRNAANPKDMIELLAWVNVNLPPPPAGLKPADLNTSAE